RLGVRVADAMIPPAPGRLDQNTSGIVSRIIQSAGRLAVEDSEQLGVALRFGRVLLERGSPTGQAVRELAEMASGGVAADLEWLAWSTLLGASRPEETVWWEARYHTLRLLQSRDPASGSTAYQQHRAMHPIEGPAPWGGLIRDLFEPANRVESGAGSDD
ncbi:MAG: hypothetical protein AAGA55_09925, partial [Planctomycetota bacterium]